MLRWYMNRIDEHEHYSEQRRMFPLILVLFVLILCHLLFTTTPQISNKVVITVVLYSKDLFKLIKHQTLENIFTKEVTDFMHIRLPILKGSYYF